MSVERTGLILLACLLVTACDRTPTAKSATPASTPPLAPRKVELEAAAAAPVDLGEATRNELSELIDLAYSEQSTDASLAHRAERSLRNHAHANDGLAAGLTHAEPGVRASCAFQLGERRAFAAIPELLWRLRNEFDARVKVWIADALARLENHSALPVLVAAMDDSTVADEAGEAAIRILTEAGEELGDAPTWDDLKSRLARLHDHWVRTGRRLGDDAEGDVELDPALAAQAARCLIDLTEFQLQPVDRARNALRNLGAGVVPWLDRAVGAEEPYLRLHVLEVIRDLGAPAEPLGPKIVLLLSDPVTKTEAAIALGAIGYHPARDRLVEALLSDDVELSTAAARGLGGLADPAAVASLRTVLSAERSTLDQRVFAAGALAKLGEADGTRFLEERLAAGDYHAPTLRELLEEARR